MKRNVLCNRRYSKNLRTGAAPKRKMGKGMVEQSSKFAVCSISCSDMMQGTKRQGKFEREGRSKDRKQLEVITEAKLNELKRKHHMSAM